MKKAVILVALALPAIASAGSYGCYVSNLNQSTCSTGTVFCSYEENEFSSYYTDLSRYGYTIAQLCVDNYDYRQALERETVRAGDLSVQLKDTKNKLAVLGDIANLLAEEVDRITRQSQVNYEAYFKGKQRIKRMRKRIRRLKARNRNLR